MAGLFEGVGPILTALLSADSFEISEALKHPAAYLLCGVLVVVGGYLLMLLLRLVPLLDRYLERSVLIAAYLTIAGVIFVEVIRRFVFQVQAPWSTTLPPYLFLVMTWVGCAYNTRLRTHLAFSEVRSALPRNMQFVCLSLDCLLWLGFSLVVVVTTFRQTANSASNFQILLGTDNVMQWWFYVLVPVSWLILSARAIENYLDDIRRYRANEPLIRHAALLAD